MKREEPRPWRRLAGTAICGGQRRVPGSRLPALTGSWPAPVLWQGCRLAQCGHCHEGLLEGLPWAGAALGCRVRPAQEWVQWACVIRGAYLGVPGSGSFSPEFLSVQSGANLCAGRPTADLQGLGKRPLRLGAGGGRDLVPGAAPFGPLSAAPREASSFPWDSGGFGSGRARCPFRGGTPSAPPHSASSLCRWVATLEV